MGKRRKEPHLKPNPSSPSIYEIRVEGKLGDMWANWFQGLSMREETDSESGRQTTVLLGPIPDQPALHGVLNKIRDLNLSLISVKKLEPK